MHLAFIGIPSQHKFNPMRPYNSSGKEHCQVRDNTGTHDHSILAFKINLTHCTSIITCTGSAHVCLLYCIISLYEYKEASYVGIPAMCATDHCKRGGMVSGSLKGIPAMCALESCNPHNPHLKVHRKPNQHTTTPCNTFAHTHTGSAILHYRYNTLNTVYITH